MRYQAKLCTRHALWHAGSPQLPPKASPPERIAATVASHTALLSNLAGLTAAAALAAGGVALLMRGPPRDWWDARQRIRSSVQRDFDIQARPSTGELLCFWEMALMLWYFACPTHTYHNVKC